MPRFHTHSQHFLRSPQLVKELVGHSNLKADDTVLDIGAGSGVISSVLATKCAQVIAIEPEPKTAQTLRSNLGRLSNVTILEEDFLNEPLPDVSYKVFSNIPFHLSSPIVRKLTEANNPPKAVYLILQKQFARKLVPGSDHFTAQLGTELGVRFTAKVRKPLQRTDFTPPPGVDTVLLELLLRDTPLIDAPLQPKYRTFVSECYSRQKFFAQAVQRTKLFSPELRPSQLSLDQWVNFYLLYSRK